MRDYLAAIRERIVVFDGGMGATLEQFDLSLEDDYRLPGRCHEALVLNRPDVIEERAPLDARGGRRGARDRHLPGLAAEAVGVGPGGPHRRRSTVKAAEIARKAAGERPLRGRLDRPDRLPARQRRPDARSDHASASWSTVFTEQATRPDRGRRRPDHHRDRAGHPRGQGGDLRRPRGVQASWTARVPIQCSVSLLPNGGKMLLGTDISAVLATLEALEVDVIGLNCSTGPEDMRDAIRFLGEFCSVPVHCIPNAGLPLQGPNGETIFPEKPEPLATRAGRVRRALRRLDRRRLLRDHAGPHPRDRRARRGPHAPAAARRAARPTSAR